MSLTEPCRLNSARLVIEPFEQRHISVDYLDWLNDREIMRFSNQRFRTHTAQSAQAYVSSFAHTANLFQAVKLADSGRLIGTMTAYVAVPHGAADIGLLIGERALWGHGYGLEAWNALMSYLLKQVGMRKVTGGTVRSNVGMLKIMERSGMHLEATRVRQEISDEGEQDVLYYARFVNC